MFTGIIQNLGRVSRLNENGSKLVLETDFKDLELGESVAVNGVCLTVAELLHGTEALFAVSPETLARTSLGTLEPGSRVNLERALLMSTRLSGHLVQGHVDGLATLVATAPSADKNFYQLSVEIPAELAKYCVEKGSIAFDGISLTINAIQGTRVELMIVPHTWTNTRLHTLEVGARLNLEVDLFAKYVEKLVCR
jgi:riboflavin synthase